jgi:hypothetical protein
MLNNNWVIDSYKEQKTNPKSKENPNAKIKFLNFSFEFS